MREHDVEAKWPAVALICILPLLGLLIVSATEVAHAPSGLAQEVAEHLPATGVTNPVTAVLLNYRSFDTLLEVAVLLVALLGVAVVAGESTATRPGGLPIDDGILRGVISLLSAAIIVVGGYLLWVGAYAPGGAFQAGALLASVFVLLLLSGHDVWSMYTPRTERVLLVVGIATFLAVGLGGLSGERTFLQYPTAWAKWLILAIESACTVSIGVMLFGMYRGGLRSVPIREADRRKEVGE